MKEEYDWVTQNFDKVLAEHGYVREGHYYRAEKANEHTLAFFCHFGVSRAPSAIFSVSLRW